MMKDQLFIDEIFIYQTLSKLYLKYSLIVDIGILIKDLSSFI